MPASPEQVSCYDKAGYENEHSDGGHTGAPSVYCPTCLAEAAAAQPKFLRCPLCPSISNDSVPALIAHLAQAHLEA